MLEYGEAYWNEKDSGNGTSSEAAHAWQQQRIEQKKHEMYSFYVDANVLSLGASIHITSVGGSANVWDIEYFIQRTQNAG